MITPGCENEKKKIHRYSEIETNREREIEIDIEIYRIAPTPFA